MKKRVAVVLFGAIVLVPLALFVVQWSRCTTVTFPMLDHEGKAAPLSDVAREAAKLYVDRLNNLATASLALLGFVWAFILKDEYRVRVEGGWGHLLFCLINVTLFVSYYCYWANYGLVVSDLYSTPPSVDIFSTAAQFLTYWQHFFFMVGLLGLGLLVFLFPSIRTSKE